MGQREVLTVHAFSVLSCKIRTAAGVKKKKKKKKRKEKKNKQRKQIGVSAPWRTLGVDDVLTSVFQFSEGLHRKGRTGLSLLLNLFY